MQFAEESVSSRLLQKSLDSKEKKEENVGTGDSHNHKSVEILHSVQNGLDDARPSADGGLRRSCCSCGTDCSFYTQEWRILSNLFSPFFKVMVIWVIWVIPEGGFCCGYVILTAAVAR